MDFKEMYAQLGTIRLGEKISLVLFVAATLLAFIRPLYAGWLPALKPAYVFLIMGLLAFTFEDEDGKALLTWEFAEKGVMWGMLFLFAGGLALGSLVTETGAALKMAEAITLLPLTGGLETVFAFTLFSTVLTEISSNTAAAAIAGSAEYCAGAGAEPDPVFVRGDRRLQQRLCAAGIDQGYPGQLWAGPGRAV